MTKRERRRLDALSKVDPMRAAVQESGGELIRGALDRKKFERELAMYAPGCGSPTHVEGTNGGQIPCGARLTQFGKTAPYFCAACQTGL
jgi:hypothetical protein